MKLIRFYLLIASAMISTLVAAQQKSIPFLDTRVDNIGYWKEAAKQGLTQPNPMVRVAPAIFTGSKIRAFSVITDDSPDVPTVTGATSQSENSVSVDPNDNHTVLNSNNSTNTPSGGITLYGADALYSFDGGEAWEGSIQGAGGSNNGDPVALIGNNGWYYIGFIENSWGQGVAISQDQGNTWTTHQVASNGYLYDKNHMWIDKSTSSPYEGYLYVAWTDMTGGSYNNEICLSYSTDGGIAWSPVVEISSEVNAGSHNQGVNITTGPDGEIYAVWVIYDSWPSDEKALGMATSFDGGATWLPATRILGNIKGIRTSETNKDMRVNSFPSMTADVSSGPNRGNIYVVWPNIGVPGVNTGSDIDVYMIRSEDNGTTWSTPVRVNQDPSGLGKEHYFAWITCDPVTGTLSTIFYDDRNVSSSQCEVYCANSYDAGETWEDFKVSDVSFTPSPIPGLAGGYFGDYLGISAWAGQVYPCWTDNRTGTALTYVSPYLTNTVMPPTNLQATLNDTTGIVVLSWQHLSSPMFDHFNIYRDFSFIGTAVWPMFTDTLPDYGNYRFMVTAYYSIGGESGAAILDLQWGQAAISLDPVIVEAYVAPEGTDSEVLMVSNTGQLPLEYTADFTLPARSGDNVLAYCTGTGGCGEYIRKVEFGNIINTSECGSGYEDFTALSTVVFSGQAFEIKIYNGTISYPEDVCGIWIDWNQNQNFNDEAPITVQGSPGIGPYTTSIVPPDDAKNGMTRMRIRIKRGGTLSPCGLASTGEVEDYSVNVIGWVKASPLEGQVAAGEAQPVTVELDATGMALGTYQANLNIHSNDPANPEMVVPVIMHVTDIALTVTADKDSLCYGGSTALHGTVTGGSGNFTYSWTSDPPGFTSSEQNPTVYPEVTTTYFLTVTDGSFSISDQISIAVVSLPEVDLGPDVAVCQGEVAVLDAGSGFATYFWNNGTTGQTLTVSTPGIYWVDVTNEFGCSNRDSAAFSLYPLPTVSLGEDKHFCEGSSVMISAGTGFAQYEWSNGSTGNNINVSDPGEYWVLVTDDNGCTANDTIELFMDPLPGTAADPTGPVSVDNFLVTNSAYTTTGAANSSTYEWLLDPPAGGTIDGTGTSAQVTWNEGFTGTAQISVRAINDCGTGSYSGVLNVQIFSTQGIDDKKAVSGVVVYPNPNDGTFVLQLVSRNEQEIRLQIMTTIGGIILDNRESIPAGSFEKTFNLGNLPKGVYSLIIRSKEGGILSREQVVVK